MSCIIPLQVYKSFIIFIRTPHETITTPISAAAIAVCDHIASGGSGGGGKTWAKSMVKRFLIKAV